MLVGWQASSIRASLRPLNVMPLANPLTIFCVRVGREMHHPGLPAMRITKTIKKSFYKGVVRFRRRIGWIFSPTWQRRYRKFNDQK